MITQAQVYLLSCDESSDRRLDVQLQQSKVSAAGQQLQLIPTDFGAEDLRPMLCFSHRAQDLHSNEVKSNYHR